MDRIILSEISTRAPNDIDRKQTKEKTIGLIEELRELQNLLYAENKHAVLVILQGPDASGKDGVIRNIFSYMNPMGVDVMSFKKPTEEELSHDFIWRVHRHAPPKRMMHIFNRSHYEDILITRVYKWCDDEMARKRMQAINDFERLLQEQNNTHILKFYLHISQEEQHQRLEERMKDPKKMWKYNPGDLKESKRWDKYRKMYEDCFANCMNPPWIIVPSDQNWYKEFVIASRLVDLLKGLKMEYPELEKKAQKLNSKEK
jgi:PPK2 family polyphosphate:nucleotide phosphotransferase